MNAIKLDDLKTLRIKKGWTQIDVCRKVGVSLVSYQMWERRVTEPNPENYEKLQKLFEEESEE